MVGGNAGTPNHSFKSIYPLLRMFSLGYMKGLQIVHQALSLLVRNFLCKSVHPCPVWLSFQITAIPSAPFHVREKGRNVLLESNSGSVSRLQGLLSCSQMSLSYKQSRCISPPTPPPHPSGHLSTAGLFQKWLWNVLWKEEMTKCHLMAKRKLTS